MAHRRHPALTRAISPTQFEKELAWIWARGVGAGFLSKRMTYRVLYPEYLSRKHHRCSRNYAVVTPGLKTIFEFAPEVLLLPKLNRLGLLAHEVGHVLAPGGSERDADDAAEECLGVVVGYDLRWPSKGSRKGLQFAAEIL